MTGADDSRHEIYKKGDAEDWVQRAYSEPHGVIPPQFKTEPGHPPSPGGLGVTERGAERRSLGRIREILGNSRDLSVLEARYGQYKGVEAHITLTATALQVDTDLRSDDCVNTIMYWSKRLKIDFNDWSAITDRSPATLIRIYQRGKKVLQSWHDSAVRQAWEVR